MREMQYQSMRNSCEYHRKSDRILGRVRPVEIQIGEVIRSNVSCVLRERTDHESGEDNRRDVGAGREMLMNGMGDRT